MAIVSVKVAFPFLEGGGNQIFDRPLDNRGHGDCHLRRRHPFQVCDWPDSPSPPSTLFLFYSGTGTAPDDGDGDSRRMSSVENSEYAWTFHVSIEHLFNS